MYIKIDIESVINDYLITYFSQARVFHRLYPRWDWDIIWRCAEDACVSHFQKECEDARRRNTIV